MIPRARPIAPSTMTIPADQVPQNKVTPPTAAAIPPAAQADPDTPSLCLMIDNYDSFTFNLYQYLCELGAEMLVKRNDEITMEEIEVSAKVGRGPPS